MCCGILFMRRSGRLYRMSHSHVHERELWCCINENMDTEPLSIFAQLEQWAYKWTHETQSPNEFKTRWWEWKKKQLNHHVFKCGYSNFYSNLGSGISFFFSSCKSIVQKAAECEIKASSLRQLDTAFALLLIWVVRIERNGGDITEYYSAFLRTWGKNINFPISWTWKQHLFLLLF